MKLNAAFAGLIANSNTCPSDRAKRCLLHLFDEAIAHPERDAVKYVFGEGQEYLGTEVAQGLTDTMRNTGDLTFYSLFLDGNTQPVSAGVRQNAVQRGTSEVWVLKGRFDNEFDMNDAIDEAHEIKFDEATIAAINAVPLDIV